MSGLDCRQQNGGAYETFEEGSVHTLSVAHLVALGLTSQLTSVKVVLLREDFHPKLRSQLGQLLGFLEASC